MFAALGERAFSLAADCTGLTAAAPLFGQILIYCTVRGGGGWSIFENPG